MTKVVNYSGGRKSLTLPVAKREIHNGCNLWAELLGILLSGPNMGMCSRNADRRPAVPMGREEEGVGGIWQAPASVEEVRVTPMGEPLH